ncbi:MAG: nucleotidyltransferase family protein [Deltaproteobacteria bacterium]
MLKTEIIKEKLLEKTDQIRKEFYVRQLGIFGSYVREEQTEDSDIDILVDFEKGHKDFFNYMKLKIYLESVLGREVDLVMKDAVKPRLKEIISREVSYV